MKSSPTVCADDGLLAKQPILLLHYPNESITCVSNLFNLGLIISDKNTWLGAEKEPRKKGDSDWLQVEAKKPPTPYHLARGAREPSGPNQEHPLKHPSGAFLRFWALLPEIAKSLGTWFYPQTH
jgi:hypothetical protein